MGACELLYFPVILMKRLKKPNLLFSSVTKSVCFKGSNFKLLACFMSCLATSFTTVLSSADVIGHCF